MKRLIAVILTVALLCTTAFNVQTVQAQTQNTWKESYCANTTTQGGEGLNFNTYEYTYYYTENTLTVLPKTFEATIRVPVAVNRAGVILGNAMYENSKSTSESGTFNFGFLTNMVPYLYIADGTNNTVDGDVTRNGTYYKFTVADVDESTYYDEKFLKDEWVHLTIVRETDKMICYVNGVEFSTIDVAYDDSSWEMIRPMVLGADLRSGNGQQFKGDIKNVAIYSNARTEEEIKTDYTAMTAEGNYSPTADENLMACYALDFDSETNSYPQTINDLSTNGFDMNSYWLTEEQMSELPEYSYSMSVIGDPQILTSKSVTTTKEYVQTTFQWVADNAESQKMKFAFNMGDTADSSTATTATDQWTVGSNAVKLLNDKVPYSIVRGNHDSIAMYNEYYAFDEYQDSISGSYDENMLNTYQKFKVGDIKYLVLNLDFGIGASSKYYSVDSEDERLMEDGSGNPDKVLEWANQVVQANKGYNVIVTTHGYTNSDGTRLTHDEGTSSSAPTCSSATREGYQRAYSGEDIYEKLVKDNSNIVMVLSGHVGADKMAYQYAEHTDGTEFVELVVNPQTTDKKLDGCGLVAMLYFQDVDTETNTQDVTIRYYSTLRDKYYLEENQNITLTLNVINDDIIENADGSIVLSYNDVAITENVTFGENNYTPVPEDYKDYLFAGWFTDTSCKTVITDKTQVNETSYAKFWPSDLLNIKVQTTNGIVTGETSEATKKYNDNYVIRFVSSLQNLDPISAGFEVYLTDGTFVGKSTSKKAFKGIESTNAGSTYDFSPKVISNLSEWFITAKMPVAPANIDTDYVVRAYWTTADGTTVYGKSRCVAVSDNNVVKEEGVADTLNVVINGELTGSGYTASFVSSSDKSVTTDDFTVSGASVEVLEVGDGYSNVRITLPEDGDSAKMASLTKITIDGTTYYGMFRNYNTSHASGDASNPYADTSWYYESEDKSNFVIASSADLYGLANVVNDEIDNFSGNTVTLVRDVTVNKGTAIARDADTNTEAQWLADDGELTYKWAPIGKDNSWDTSFSGTFDGEGNVISGVVISDDGTDYNGLFGRTNTSSVLSNIYLTNSYMEASDNFLGSIAGFARSAKLEGLYSNAILSVTYTDSNETDSSKYSVGGIVGRYGNPDDAVSTLKLVKNTWFDGEIYVSGNVKRVGGIVGDMVNDRNNQFSNCLYTGHIEYDFTGITTSTYTTQSFVGGIYGYEVDALTSRSQILSNCLMAGKIVVTDDNETTSSGDVSVGTFVGRISANKKGISKNWDQLANTIKNCYAITDMSTNGVTSTIDCGYTHQKSWYGTVTSGVSPSAYWVSDPTTLYASTDAAVAELFPALDGESESAWTYFIDEDGTAGLPILREFAHTWQKLNSN